MEEIWVKIQDYQDYYVSNYGNVKSTKYGRERILKAGIGGDGYYSVVLCKDSKQKTFKVHQLVAIAFLEHKPCGYKLVVNHKDHNKLNNNLNNLEIVTVRENIIKSLLHKGYCEPFKGRVKSKIKSSLPKKYAYWHNHNKKWQATIKIDGKFKFLGYYDTEIEAKNVVLNFISNK